MPCTELGAEQLMDFLLEDLAEPERARAAAHVAVCAECAENLETLRGLNEVVWAIREFQDLRVPPEVHAQILDRCREALLTMQAARSLAPAGVRPAFRAGSRGSRSALRRLRAVAFAALPAAVIVVLYFTWSRLFGTGSRVVARLEQAGGHVMVLKPGEREGFLAGGGQPLQAGDRVETTRLATGARVALEGGGTVHVGGLSTVRFLDGRRVDVLRGRAFAELAGKTTTVNVGVDGGRLTATAHRARFDVRLLPAASGPAAALAGAFGPGAAAPGPAFSALSALSAARPLALGTGLGLPPPDVLLTVVEGSVEYVHRETKGTIEAGKQLRAGSAGVVTKSVPIELFSAHWMTDAECDALPVETLRRLIAGPIARRPGGRVRLQYSFSGPQDLADWRPQVGTGTWSAQSQSLRGVAGTGERGLIYHVARFLGDVEVDYDLTLDAAEPRTQTLWRIYAEPTRWEASGMSGWAAVETVEDSAPVRKLSLHYLDQTLASAPAPTLRGGAFHVRVTCAEGRVAFQAGGEAPLTAPVGSAPTSGHVGLGVAGGAVEFRNVVLVGRLEPEWIRYALEQLGEQDLSPPAAPPRPL